jgi:hypothetical protein
VWAHKQDLPSALSPEAVADTLELPFNPQAEGNDEKCRHHANNAFFHVEGSMGNTGMGLYEGMDWLCNKLIRHK